MIEDSIPTAGDAAPADLPLKVVTRSTGKTTGSGQSRKKKLMVVVVLLVALAFAVFLIRTKKAAPEVASAPLNPSVFALGRLEPEGELISLAAPGGAGDARIGSLEVQEGDVVKAGDLLAKLDSEARLAAAVAVAESNVEQARTAIERTRLDVTTMKTQLEAALRSAEASLEQAEANSSRYSGLAKEKAVSSEQNEEVQLKLKSAREAVAETMAKLARYQPGANGDAIDIILSRRELDAAEASLRQARANLDDSRIKAPSDATILRIHARPGERIGQGPFIEMGRVSQMMARVEVYESEVPSITIGQAAVLTASPLSTPLHGTVQSISSLVKKQEIVEANPAANTDSRVMDVWVKLDGESSPEAARFVNLQVRVEFVK